MKKYQKNWLPVNIGHRQERRIKSLAQKSGESRDNRLLKNHHSSLIAFAFRAT
tara:strand:- start:286 stop:444 length:159 start_codon:yes stop_codon:yes gene_type:complete